MTPIEICNRLGPERVTAMLQELNSSQLKGTLKKGGVATKVPSRVISQKARRKLWATRALGALEEGSDEIAGSLLYEWLLNHRRPMLIEYLDLIGVKHQGGETEENFTKTVPAETLLGAVHSLARNRPPHEVATYVLYLDHHQESDVYGSSPQVVALLGGEDTAADTKD